MKILLLLLVAGFSFSRSEVIVDPNVDKVFDKETCNERQALLKAHKNLNFFDTMLGKNYRELMSLFH